MQTAPAGRSNSWMALNVFGGDTTAVPTELPARNTRGAFILEQKVRGHALHDASALAVLIRVCCVQRAGETERPKAGSSRGQMKRENQDANASEEDPIFGRPVQSRNRRSRSVSAGTFAREVRTEQRSIRELLAHS